MSCQSGPECVPARQTLLGEPPRILNLTFPWYPRSKTWQTVSVCLPFACPTGGAVCSLPGKQTPRPNHRNPAGITQQPVATSPRFLRDGFALLWIRSQVGTQPLTDQPPPEPASSGRLEHIQADVEAWIQQHGVRYFSELTNLAQLMEEVGELARAMSRTYGEQSCKAGEQPTDLADEMADVLFVLVCLANQTGVDLSQAWARNLEKKTQRDARRHHENPKLQDS